MRSKRYILASLFVLNTFYAMGCWYSEYTPAQYFMPRITEYYAYKHPNRDSLLIEDWRKMTAKTDIPFSDVEEVIYRYSIRQIKEMVGDSNMFARWILKNRRNDIREYLIIAKNSQKVREDMDSRWYYHYPGDWQTRELKRIAQLCIVKADLGGSLHDRYILQALRALSAVHDYKRVDSVWQNCICEGGIIEDLCKRYAARADFELGRKDEALKYYGEANDIVSIVYCLNRMGIENRELDIVENLAIGKNGDKCTYILQRWFAKKLQYEDSIPQKEADQVCRISNITSKYSKNPALWFYVEALALDLSGRTAESAKALSKAQKARGTFYIKESIHLMSIYLDAKLSKYDNSYKNRLLGQLMWINRRIERDATKRILDEIIDCPYYTRDNFSHFYWNDMLRKIVMGTISPRMMEAGDTTLAVRLVNMADNYILRLGGYERGSEEHNGFDYSNILFGLLNKSITVNAVERYVSSLDKPGSKLESYLDSLSYTDRNYFRDIVGTRYLRQREYGKAARVFATIGPTYQDLLNTSKYMNVYPFAVSKKIDDEIISNYKYKFAKEMESFEKVMAGNSSNDIKGVVKIRYGLGMKASFSFAWPLTQYFYGTSDFGETEVAIADSIIHKGVEMIQNRELKAQQLVVLQCRREVVQKYPETKACKEILTHCDQYRDYCKIK